MDDGINYAYISVITIIQLVRNALILYFRYMGLIEQNIIVGDATYATDFKDIHTSRMMLHAYRLRMNLSNVSDITYDHEFI